jgi:hypothetical protein
MLMKALLCGLLLILTFQMPVNAVLPDPTTGMGFNTFLNLSVRAEANDKTFTPDERDSFLAGGGFLYGFLHTVVRERKADVHEFPFSLPDNLTPAHIILIMRKFVKENPEKLHMKTIELLYEGLTKVYPNPKYKAKP